MNKTYENIYESFETYFPSIAEKVVDWYPIGKYEIRIELLGVDDIIYNPSLRSYRKYRPIAITNEVLWTKEFSLRFKSRFEESGLTRKELSNKSGLSQNIIRNYLNGSSQPTLHNVIRLADALGCSLNELSYFD